MSEGYSSKPMQATKIGDRIVRVDAVQKARGEAVYVCDMTLPNMQYAYMVRSTIARGRIKAIHVPELPEGYYFISAKDIPAQGKNELWMIAKDWRCFAEDYVLYVGETIGLVVGPDRSVLKRLKAQIKIDYEEQTPAVTIDDGIHCVGGPMFPEKNSNVMCELFCEKGRPMDEVFAEADEVFEETIETPYQEHVHLETNSAIADMEDGKFVFYASAQCPFYIRKSIAGLLDIPYDDIIVRQCTTGGAFGGKEHFPDVLCGALLVAENKIRKPIKMVFDREEDTQFSVKRHPSKCIYKTAVKDGKITGVYGHIYYNCGAYLSSSYVVLQRGVFHGNGVYTFDNTYLKGEGIGTNMFPSCAFRGFGAPQTLFAIETHLDHLAHHLGVDPLEFKMQYLAKKGDETTTNGHIIEEVKLPEMLDVITRESDYWRKAKEYKPGCGRGIGIALYNHGGAFTGNGEQVHHQGARAAGQDRRPREHSGRLHRNGAGLQNEPAQDLRCHARREHRSDRVSRSRHLQGRGLRPDRSLPLHHGRRPPCRARRAGDEGTLERGRLHHRGRVRASRRLSVGSGDLPRRRLPRLRLGRCLR